MTMTIKDLCNVTPICTECSFAVLCPEYECPADYDFYSEDNARITTAIIETARRLEKPDQNRLIVDIKSDIDKLTTYKLTNKTLTISKKAVDRVFNLHLYGSRDANGKKERSE